MAAGSEDPAGGTRLTERLSLRPPRPEDREAYERIFLRPEVQRWLRPSPEPEATRADVGAMIARDQARWRELGYGPWACCDLVGEQVCARVGLQPQTVEGVEEVELLWTVDPDRHGEGIATEAAAAGVGFARALGLASIVSLVLPQNLASRAVAEKIGMAGEGKVIHAGLAHVIFRLALT